MKHTPVAAVFLALLLLFCLIPSAGMLLFGASAAGANEVQSAAPVLRDADGAWNTGYLSDLADYVSDHFYLRQELITAHNALTAAVFRVSAEDDVILGADGWLYYAPTLDDYTGTAPMTERALFSAAHNLSLMQEYALAQGADFLFVIAPNKNSLYADAMPDYGAGSEPHDAQRLFALLDAYGVQYTDLFSRFSAEAEPLYFRHDSHWNTRGAALAADAINACFGIRSDYFSDAFAATAAHTGDLFEMLYPTAADPETDVVYGGALTLDYETASVRPDSITIRVSGGGEKRLLAYRDSFGNLLYPYLADSFGWSRFSRSSVYDLTAIGAEDIDCVLVELVERNLDYLLAYMPLCPSPVRALTLPETVSGTVSAAFDSDTRAPEGCAAFTGTAPAGTDADSPVYVVCGGSVYDAFLGADGAFTAYLPAEAAGTDECAVICFVSGEAARYVAE